MTLEKNWKEWQHGQKWEFFKDANGLWHWRAISPEGWDHKKGEWKAGNWPAQQWEKKEWTSKDHNWSHEGINWVEVSRSTSGYHSKTECESDAKKHGWS